MLQRTRADIVATIYPSFFAQYPTGKILAKTKPKDLEKVMKPLGLSHRIPRVMDLAMAISKLEAIPNEKETLLNLPGVGPYVADAVQCYAFGKSVIPIDVNTIRVLGRLFGPLADHEVSTCTDEVLTAFKKSNVKKFGVRRLNWALLDLAKSICKSWEPECARCPLRFGRFGCRYPKRFGPVESAPDSSNELWCTLKLREANFFFSELERCWYDAETENCRYFLSAFLSATCSIPDHALEDANEALNLGIPVEATRFRRVFAKRVDGSQNPTLSEFQRVWQELVEQVTEDPLLSLRHVSIHRKGIGIRAEPLTGGLYLVPEIDGSPMFVDDASGTVYKLWLFAEGLEEVSLVPYCRSVLNWIGSYVRKIEEILPKKDRAAPDEQRIKREAEETLRKYGVPLK
jgi:A/G-specific adenine glycosylase